MNTGVSIASVCRTLPTPDDPAYGVFVARRLAAVSGVSRVSVLQPVPYCPLVRPKPHWSRSEKHVAEGVDIHHAPMFYLPKVLKHLDGYWLYRSVIEPLAALKQEEKLDIIDAHFAYPDGAGCLRAARVLDVPVVMTLRGVEEEQLQVPAIARQVRSALASVDGCICVSHSLQRLAIAAGANENQTRVIHNAVNRGVFRPGDQKAARYGLPVTDDDAVVVSVGNLLSVKRHDVLIRAFALLRRRIDRARLVIVGGAMHEPETPTTLRKLCEELGIAESVSFVGRASESEVATWLKAADVFALASRREGCCNAILEALASGLPVVATAVGDNPWFIRDGENGYLVPVGDYSAFGDALRTTIERENWDGDRISSMLPVGDWDSVAGNVLEFLTERIEARHAEKRGASAHAGFRANSATE